MNTLHLIAAYQSALLNAAGYTFALFLLASACGIPLGILIGFATISTYRPGVAKVVKTLLYIGTALPVLAVMFWLHYPAQSILGIVVDPFWTAALALGLTNAIAVGGIVSRAASTIPPDLSHLALMSGASHWQQFSRVTLPFGLLTAMPSILLAEVGVIHGTMFASLISVPELFRAAQTINAQEHDPVGVYTALIVFYFMVCFPLLLAVEAAHRWTLPIIKKL